MVGHCLFPGQTAAVETGIETEKGDGIAWCGPFSYGAFLMVGGLQNSLRLAACLAASQVKLGERESGCGERLLEDSTGHETRRRSAWGSKTRPFGDVRASGRLRGPPLDWIYIVSWWILRRK